MFFLGFLLTNLDNREQWGFRTMDDRSVDLQQTLSHKSHCGWTRDTSEQMDTVPPPSLSISAQHILSFPFSSSQFLKLCKMIQRNKIIMLIIATLVLMEQHQFIINKFQRRQTQTRHQALLLMATTASTSLSYGIHQPRIERPKSIDDWHRVSPNLQDDWTANNFQAHFRLSRDSFMYLVQRLNLHPAFRNEAHNSTPTEYQIAIAL